MRAGTGLRLALTCLLLTSSFLAAAEPVAGAITFRIVNSSSHTIYGARVSPSSDPKWSQNLLSVAALPPNASTVVRLDDACRPYDLRLAAEGRLTMVDAQLALCGDPSSGRALVITIHERELTKTLGPREDR